MPADDKTAKSSNGKAAAPAPEPVVQVLGQYVKDLSFENPNAPQSFQQQQQTQQPKLDITIAVGVREMGDNVHEVMLSVENRLSKDKMVLFHLQLEYAGAFRVEGLPEDVKNQVLRIQCPTLLFPFVRRLVADLTRDGGFPQLYLDPIDFGQLYMQELAKQQAAGGKVTV